MLVLGGNPTDELEGAYAVISAAVGLRAYVKLRRGGRLRAAPVGGGWEPIATGHGVARLLRSALKVLQHYFPREAGEVFRDPPDVVYRSEIPSGAGWLAQLRY